MALRHFMLGSGALLAVCGAVLCAGENKNACVHRQSPAPEDVIKFVR
jgi:hypothetical protein